MKKSITIYTGPAGSGKTAALVTQFKAFEGPARFYPGWQRAPVLPNLELALIDEVPDAETLAYWLDAIDALEVLEGPLRSYVLATQVPVPDDPERYTVVRLGNLFPDTRRPAKEVESLAQIVSTRFRQANNWFAKTLRDGTDPDESARAARQRNQAATILGVLNWVLGIENKLVRDTIGQIPEAPGGNQVLAVFENLNRENFFNAAYQKYPLAVARFCSWVDEYKTRVDWLGLIPYAKFHDLPIELQRGVLLQFAWDQETAVRYASACFTGQTLPELLQGANTFFMALNEILKDE